MTGQSTGLFVSALQTFSKQLKLAPKLVCRILEECFKCSDFKSSMMELSRCLLQDEEKQVSVLKEIKEQELCFKILTWVGPSPVLLKEIRKENRTQYVKDMIECKKFKDAEMAVESGQLDQSINIPVLMARLLEYDNERLLKKLLDAKVDVKATRNGKLPNSMKLLSKMCSPQAKTNFDIKCRAVKYMHLLLGEAHGVDVEEMKEYSRGSRTSPLHVATHLALETGTYAYTSTHHRIEIYAKLYLCK